MGIKKNLPTVSEIIYDLLTGLNDLKNHDIDGDGKVTINDVTALIDKILIGDNEEEAPDDLFEVNGVSFKMIPVKPGAFTMGSPATETGSGTNERPQHKVTLTKGYYIGETPVTNGLWKAVMGSIPSKHKGLDSPVEMVNWVECQAFIAKLNELTGKKFRLPTEAEWEFAARGGTLSKGTIFAGSNTPKDVAWYTTNSGGTTQPVGQKAPNELGLYDMSGNVSEFVADRYGAYTAQDATDPTGPSIGNYKVYRNGSYQDAAKECRVARRYPAAPDYKQPFLGMRLAL